MKLSVLIPTLAERRAQLEHTVYAYRQTAPGCEVLTTSLFDSVFSGWGAGCNYLASHATGDVFLFPSDDAVPRPGWFEAGLEALDRGVMPRAKLHEGGESRSTFDQAPDWQPLDFSAFLFLPRHVFEQVGPVQPGTWYTDVDYCARLREYGWLTVARAGFEWDHLNLPRRWFQQDLDADYRAAAGL